MSSMARAIFWPVVTLLVIGGTHLVAEAIRPELHDVVGPAVVMPIYLIVGGWTAIGVVRSGGSYPIGLAAGAILGLMPAALQLVGFGILLGRDGAVVTTSAIFGFMAMLWGSALGAGIAASSPAIQGSPARSPEPDATIAAGTQSTASI